MLRCILQRLCSHQCSIDEDGNEDNEDTDDNNAYVSDLNISHILQALENDDVDETG